MTQKRLSIITLICFALGIIVGFLVPNFCLSISFLGTAYVNLLKVMIVPVLFTSIASSLSKASTGRATRVTIKAVMLFIVMFICSFLISMGLITLIKPGVGFNFTPVDWGGEITSTTFSEFFISIFPSNIIESMRTNAILPVILFAFVFGLAVAKSESTRLVILLEDLSNSLNTMLRYIMYLTPVGVFALMGNTVASYGIDVIKSALIYIGTAWLGCWVIALLVMILPVWIFAGINPWSYIKRVYKIWLITLSTCASAATLPHTIKMCNEEFNIPSDITNIVVPLGCTIHMCGGAVSFSLLAMFNMEMYGIPMTWATFAVMLIAALLINMGAPGIPGGGIVIGASYLSLLGLPLTFIGFYAGIYRLLDMVYTTMNVFGDISANILINHSENKGG